MSHMVTPQMSQEQVGTRHWKWSARVLSGRLGGQPLKIPTISPLTSGVV